ncbi:MAG: protein kinase [Chthonomonadales bacterium]|nr:protein kinase [Chthonomonadales bacterium]
MIGQVVHLRYEVLERVGEGTLLQAYKARDKVMGRMVALKALQPAYARDPAVCAALRSVAGETAALTHPNIARVFEIAEEDGVPFLVTEFVRGINLKERIRRIAPFTLSVAVDFGIAIGEALQHAHGAGILHGDLRPHNVAVSPEGVVKVTDFGMLHAAAASPRAFQTAGARAVHYQAPELSEGRPPSPSADLYALGVILFEMLTGSLPFPGESPQAIAARHQRDPVPSPRSLNSGVPRSLEGIVMKALQKRPEDRYAAATDLLSDLRSVRDALRFGRSLSWTPFEAAPAAANAPAASAVHSPSPPKSVPPPRPDPAPAAMPAARMSPTAAADESLSPWLKLALGTVLVILLGSAIVGLALWFATSSKPPAARFPKLVGMRIEDARAVADKAHVKLVIRRDYDEKADAGIIYRSDREEGVPVRPGHSILVWVSRGSRRVWVPDVTGMDKDAAVRKLEDAGLTLGLVNREYNDTVAFDQVIRQNPRAGKRVLRDTPANLALSDGPNLAETPAGPPPDAAFPDEAQGGGTGALPDASNEEPQTYTLTVKVKEDGRGQRQVRVEYDDAHGTNTPIDESHGEGDVITQQVEVFGPRITIRVYYGDDPVPVSERTRTLRR